MKIRRAKKKDLKEILNVFKKSSVLNPKDSSHRELEDYIKFCLANKNIVVLVVEEKGAIIAVGSSHLHTLKKTDANIYDIYVLNEFRDNGIGTKMIQEFYKILKNKGIKHLGLYSENNKKTLDFYKKQGFQIGRLIRRCDKFL